MSNIRPRVRDCLGVADDAFSKTSICVFPQSVVSKPPYALSRIFAALGIEPEGYSPWKRYDICVCFEDATEAVIDVTDYVTRSSRLWICDEITGEWRIERNQMGRFINRTCTDISKRRVATIFQEIFGYALDVDPRSYTGRMVRKSNVNAAHDGKVIIGPISDAEYVREHQEYVYSVHVNNIEGDTVSDLRLPWFGHLSPLLYRNQRPVSARFANRNTLASLESTSAHLSECEVSEIGEFCRAFGLDYGELDCLRDYDSGRIYIVDVNKTPCGPPNALDAKRWEEAVVNLAAEFAKGFLMDQVRA